MLVFCGLFHRNVSNGISKLFHFYYPHIHSLQQQLFFSLYNFIISFINMSVRKIVRLIQDIILILVFLILAGNGSRTHYK